MLKKEYKYGFKVSEKPLVKSKKGLDRKVVEEISALKSEPKWMLEYRLKALDYYLEKPLPEWGGNLKELDFSDIYYYLKPSKGTERSWSKVPKKIKETFERLGVPQSERKFLAGSGAMFESEVVYHHLKESLQKQGVIFESIEEGLKNYPELFRKHFGTVVPARDNKFSALNSAVWSGGSFIYVPKNVKVDLPLQSYFRINAERMGQFERTLIIADEGSSVHYVEGCTAPTYSSDALHAAVVEIIVMKNARVQYTTVQNWSRNVYNLVTKRAKVMENGQMFWLDCNLGSKLTMKYPACYLVGRGARAEVLSVAFAGSGQHLDAGAKVFHFAPDTSSKIDSKSISKGSGRTSYRGVVKVINGAKNVKSKVTCSALMLNKNSRSDTYPLMDINEDRVTIEHEATVSKIGEEQLFYLMSRGLSEQEASAMIVNGFIEPIVKQLPLEYAIEMNRLIEMEMEGAVG
jgi:Fe-S cluster assembly protein SufB